MLIVILAFAAIISDGPSPKPVTDVCASKIPDALKRAIETEFPRYRLPRFNDNLEEDIAANKQQGGDGCLGVAAGDFDGDGQDDYAVLLTPPRKGEVLLVAARRSADRWRLTRLRTWKSERARIYVGPAPPGKYSRSESFDYPPSEPGELESFESRLNGVVTGRTEASGIYYFWTPRGWIHVWAVD
jgi:hypothetical protein